MSRKFLFILIGGPLLIGLFIGAIFLFRHKDKDHGEVTLKSFTVFIDNVEYGEKNNTITFTYGDGYNYKNHIRVLAEYTDGSEEEIYENEYDMATNITTTSGIGKYFLTIAYGGLTPVNVNLVVEPLILDFTGTKWIDAEYVYNGKEQEITLVNLPVGLPKDVLTYSNNKQKNAGEYEVKVSIAESPNYRILNYDPSLSTHTWVINKLVVDLTDQPWNYTDPFTYDGAAHEITLVDLPEGLDVEYSNNIQKNAGTYTAKATFVPNPGNVEFTPDFLEKEFIINKQQIDFSQTRWDDKGNYVYNGFDQTIDITDVPRLPKEVTYTLANNEKMDVGTYTATFTINESSNYECIGISNDLLTHDWSILKATAKFTIFEAYNKVYDGKGVSYRVENNVGAPQDIHFKIDGGSYTHTVPKDAGGYTLRTIITETDNYYGTQATTEFVISKKLVSWPKGNVEKYPYFSITCGQSGEGSVHVPLIGYDDRIMRFTSDSDAEWQQFVDIYTYKVELKDTANYAWDDSTKPGDDKYTWFFNPNITSVVPVVKYNGNTAKEDFEKIEYFHPGDKLEFDIGEHGPNVVHINGTDYSHGTFTVGNTGPFEIEVINSDKRLYYRVCKVSNEFGINEIKLNDTNYYFDGNDFSYDLGENQKVDIKFKIDKSSVKTLVVNNVQLDLDDPKIIIEDVGSQIGVVYLCYDMDKDGSFVINVIKDNVVKSFDVITVSPSDSTPLATNYIMDKCPDSSEIKLSKVLIYDIAVNYYANYADRGYTRKIIDIDTNAIADFSKIKSTYNLRIEIYDDSGNCIQTINNITIKLDELVYTDFECIVNPQTNEKHYVKCITENSITISIKDSLYTYLDMYRNNEQTNIITYDNNGAYRERIVFKKSFFGINYMLISYIDIIYSERLNTFAESMYYKLEDGNSIYFGQNDNNSNVFAYDASGTCSMLDIYDVIQVEISDITCNLKDDHYAFKDDESKIEFLDEHNKDLLRFVLTLKFHDGSNYHILYAITYYSGSYSDSTAVVGEKAIETYAIDKDHKKDIVINDDVMNIENISPLYSYEFELENESDIIVTLSGIETPIYEEEGAKVFNLFFSEAGDYTLTITTVTGATRNIVMHVSGNFGNIIETQIGDGTKVYIDNNLNTNMSIYDDETGEMEYLVGFYGADSSSHVSDNKVTIKISGSILDYIYKDANFATPIATPTDTLNVLVDIYNNQYVELFMANKYIRLYLTDQPDRDITIGVGGENYGLIFKNGYSYYGEIDTNNGDFYVEPDGFSSNLVITSKQVYDDYSYAIIVVDDESEFDNYTSYSEMETQMKLFRVKDSETLTLEIKKFENRMIYILPYGTKDNIYNPKKNAHPLIINMPVYNFIITAFDDDSTYYYGKDIEGNEITNAYSVENEQYYFKVGKEKGSGSEGALITFKFDSTFIDYDDLLYVDADTATTKNCYDPLTNTFSVKHNTDEGDVIIFFNNELTKFVKLEFVDKLTD